MFRKKLHPHKLRSTFFYGFELPLFNLALKKSNIYVHKYNFPLLSSFSKENPITNISIVIESNA
jgi:hypothetical protein